MATIIGTRKTIFMLDSTDFSAEVSNVTLSSGESDSDFVSFADALAGGLRDYTLKLTIRQDTAVASLWYYIWNEAGDDVTYEFWPNGGGVTESATTPCFSGSVTITEPDGDLLGGEANASPSMVNVVEVEWKCTDKPTLAIA